jgi:hypothetical protein
LTGGSRTPCRALIKLFFNGSAVSEWSAKPDHDETNDFCIVLILKNDDLSQVYTPIYNFEKGG